MTIPDCRLDTLTPRLLELGDLHAAAPTLLAAAVSNDPQFGQLARHAIRSLKHYHLPAGLTLPTEFGPAWIGVIAKKLESMNKFRFPQLQAGETRRWEKAIWECYLKTHGIASIAGAKALGRAPRCSVRMSINLVRLVPSARNFTKDYDNEFGSQKCFNDGLKRVGLIKEDNKKWLQMAPVTQDLTSIDCAATVFVLRPLALDLLTAT